MDMYQKREQRKKDKENNQEKSLHSTSINWYPGHMAKTKRQITEKLDLIDIIYEIVDARIPFSSKITDIEKFTKNKIRILIFSKTDLCDLDETNKWIKYYEKKGYHVLALNLEKEINYQKIIKLTEELLIEKRTKDEKKGLLKRKAKVLVVGVPNVGKSTLINRLVGKKVATTGNKPGVTKSLSWIRINNDLELLDSPGILWPNIDSGNIALNLASFTAIKEEVLPLFQVSEYILKTLEKFYPDKLEERYDIKKLSEEILDNYDLIGKKRGALVKGGEIDYDKVINLIINDIKNGNIKGITFDRCNDE